MATPGFRFHLGQPPRRKFGYVTSWGSTGKALPANRLVCSLPDDAAQIHEQTRHLNCFLLMRLGRRQFGLCLPAGDRTPINRAMQDVGFPYNYAPNLIPNAAKYF